MFLPPVLHSALTKHSLVTSYKVNCQQGIEQRLKVLRISSAKLSCWSLHANRRQSPSFVGVGQTDSRWAPEAIGDQACDGIGQVKSENDSTKEWVEESYKTWRLKQNKKDLNLLRYWCSLRWKERRRRMCPVTFCPQPYWALLLVSKQDCCPCESGSFACEYVLVRKPASSIFESDWSISTQSKQCGLDPGRPPRMQTTTGTSRSLGFDFMDWFVPFFSGCILARKVTRVESFC